jgi:hypothetical protein
LEFVLSAHACGLCGRDPAAGFAKVGDVRYCHGDHDREPTHYMIAQFAHPDIAGHTSRSMADVLAEIEAEENA